MFDRNNKSALVTGASSGMGKEIAKRLIADGYQVYVAARRVAEMDDLKALGAHPLRMDIASEADIVAAVDTMMAQTGGVDVLVNNAGFGLYGPMEEIGLDEARYQFEVNVFGPGRLTQLLLPAMRAKKAGRIINITSMGGKIYTPLGSWYHATKHALEGWSDCLRLELAPLGIDVIVIEPGLIETGFGDVVADGLLKRSGTGPYAGLTRAVAAGTRETYAKGRTSHPRVIAEVVGKAVSAVRPPHPLCPGQIRRAADRDAHMAGRPHVRSHHPQPIAEGRLSVMRPASADRCKVPHGLWNAVEAIGIPPSALLRQARLPITLPQTGQAITTAQYFALMRALEALSGDPAIGLKIVSSADTAVHPPSTLAAFYARDLRDGLERLARFKRLCTPEILEVTEGLHGGLPGCSVGMAWLHAGEAEPSASVDATFSTLIELARRGTGTDVRPLRVDLARQGPRSDAHERYFAAPIRLGAPRNLLLFDVADLDRPFPGHNPELLAMLTPALGSALEEMQARSLSEQVVLELKRSLPSGRPDVNEVARRMGMSERTLQRRITEEGRSFRELLIEARRELGHRFLSDVAMELDEIAFLLGYQDATSFNRAFREWEGVTPARWRELRASDATYTTH